MLKKGRGKSLKAILSLEKFKLQPRRKMKNDLMRLKIQLLIISVLCMLILAKQNNSFYYQIIPTSCNREPEILNKLLKFHAVSFSACASRLQSHTSLDCIILF
jgi:hypothetical protein